MLEDLWDCRYLLAGLVLLIAISVAGIIDGQMSRTAFFEAHHCRDIANGYICADGAVIG